MRRNISLFLFYMSDPCYLLAERHRHLVSALTGVLYHKIVKSPQPGGDLVTSVGLLGVLGLGGRGGTPASSAPASRLRIVLEQLGHGVLAGVHHARAHLAVDVGLTGNICIILLDGVHELQMLFILLQLS